MAEHGGKIGGPIGAVFVGPEIETNGNRMRAGGETRRDRLHPVIVETKPIDRGPIFAQPEQAWLRIAGLRARRGGAHFQKTEPKFRQRAKGLGVFIESGRQADWIGKRQPGNLHAQAG